MSDEARRSRIGSAMNDDDVSIVLDVVVDGDEPRFGKWSRIFRYARQDARGEEMTGSAKKFESESLRRVPGPSHEAIFRRGRGEVRTRRMVMLDEKRNEIYGAARGTSPVGHGLMDEAASPVGRESMLEPASPVGRESVDETGGDWRKIDRRMRLLARRRAALDAEEARMLVAARRAEVHVHLGLGSFIEYMERVLGLAPHAARERMRVAEALENLPATREALAAGEVSFSTVRELTRVAQPHNEEDWLVATQGCTAREVEDAVRGHKPGDDPDDRPDPALETRKVKIEMDPRAYALFLQARRALEAEHGQEMTDSDFIAEVSLGALERVGMKSSNKPAHAVAITQCRDCKRAWQETGSKSIELPAADVERAQCDAVLLGDVDGEAPHPTEGSIPRPVRRAVLARDHFRCVVPGCRSSNHIDVHHLDPRALGGSHEMTNLITLCDCHHTAVHKGRIRIDGTPGALVVTHADGRSYGTPPPTFDELVRAPAPTISSRTALRQGGGTARGHTPPPPSVADDARLALTTMGFKRAEAARAVDLAMSDVARDSTLEQVLRAALRAYPQSRT